MRITLHPDNARLHRAEYEGVRVDFRPSENNCGITVYDIHSDHEHKGLARQALILLKAQFTRIHVNYLTDESFDSLSFWQKMMNEGHVNLVMLKSGLLLTVNHHHQEEERPCMS